MAVRQALGFVGAVVGAYFGNPQLGYAIGSAIGGIVDPLVIKGPSLGDLATQTSQEGGPRPFVFGLSAPMAGNIIASGNPRLVKKTTRQGKGGPKVKTEHVYRSYAVGICEGPITRVVRVWRNAELVYSVQGIDELNIHAGPGFAIEDILTRIFSNNLIHKEHSKFYLGTFDQEPDERLEEEFGVGTTPAFRGTAYMAVLDDDLTDQRGAIPQYTFQVERCEGVFFTSRPYPLEAADALDVTGAILPKLQPVLLEGMEISGGLVSGELDEVLIDYDDGAPEALDLSGELVSGELDPRLITYEDGVPEALDVSAELISGALT